MIRLIVHLVILGRSFADLPTLRPLLRISLSKYNLRRTVWFLVNRFLWITFSPLALDGCIIQRDALMLTICFIVVVYLWIMHPGTYRFGIRLYSFPMGPLRIIFSMNEMQPTTAFVFRLTILIMVCPLLRILLMY